MAGFDVRPTLGGMLIDPAERGGSVDSLALFEDPARTGPPEHTVATAAVKVGSGRYRFTLPTVDPGRYYARVTFTPGTGEPQTTMDVLADLPSPTDSGLVVSPESVAVRLGVALPLTAEARETISAEIRSAMADVENYLNRPLIPTEVLIPDARPSWDVDLWDWDRAWWPYNSAGWRDEVSIVGWTGPDADGQYKLRVAVGMDGSRVEAITRFVRLHATESVRSNTAYGLGSREVRSLSAEGQSISYVDAPSGGGSGGSGAAAAGSMPTFDSLRRYKKPSIYMNPAPSGGVWPNSPSRAFGWGRW